MTVPPPAETVWWDVTQKTADALAILRLSDTDVDAGYIATVCVPASGARINQFIDDEYGLPPVPGAVGADVDFALTLTIVNAYRQKDSPPASADDFGLSPGYVVTDILPPAARALLAPHRRRWGIS